MARIVPALMRAACQVPINHEEATLVGGLFGEVCPATSYSPTTSRLQYHRR